MSFNREKFIELLLKIQVGLEQLDKGIYFFYLKMRIFFRIFWLNTWRVASGITRFFRNHPRLVVATALCATVALIANKFFSDQPASFTYLLVLILCVIAIGVIAADALLPRSRRDTGVEYASLN